MQLPTKLPWDLAQTRWASILNPLIKILQSGTREQVLIGGDLPEFGDVPYQSLPLVTQTTKGAVKSAGQLLGTNTNDDAAAGYVGRHIISINSGGLSSAVNSFFNITSISLEKGDWDVTGQVSLQAFSVVTGTYVAAAVSANSANTTTDHVAGDNVLQGPNPTVGNADTSLTIAAWRVTVPVGTTKTIYLKGFCAGASGSIFAIGRISARKPR